MLMVLGCFLFGRQDCPAYFSGQADFTVDGGLVAAFFGKAAHGQRPCHQFRRDFKAYFTSMPTGKQHLL
jgi:hypothetical protein